MTTSEVISAHFQLVFKLTFGCGYFIIIIFNRLCLFFSRIETALWYFRNAVSAKLIIL